MVLCLSEKKSQTENRVEKRSYCQEATVITEMFPIPKKPAIIVLQAKGENCLFLFILTKSLKTLLKEQLTAPTPASQFQD